MACSFAKCVFETVDCTNYKKSLLRKVDKCVVDFGVVYNGHRCTFKNGMDESLATFICQELYSTVMAEIPGVSVRRDRDDLFVINNVLYSIRADGDNVCHLTQFTHNYKGQCVPCFIDHTVTVFNICLDASNVHFDERVVNRNSHITMIDQYRRAEKIVNYCYNHVCDDGSVEDNIEDVDDPMLLCSLSY